MATLLEEIQAKCSPELLATRDHDAIAAQVNIGRIRPSSLEIGNGTVLETIGLEAGNALLDAIYNGNDFRHVRPLLEQGRLKASSPLIAGALTAYVKKTSPDGYSGPQVDATGTAAHWRLYASDGTTCHAQGSVTATGGGGDLTVDSTSFVSGQPFTITGWTFTEGNA